MIYWHFTGIYALLSSFPVLRVGINMTRILKEMEKDLLSILRTNFATVKACIEPIGQDRTAHVFYPIQNKHSESMDREELEEGMVRAGVGQR